MLQELPYDEYEKINNILHKDFFSVQCQTVINRTNPGFIYVDSIEVPKTAIVFHQGESGFYFVGDHKNSAFNSIILHFIRSNLKKRLNHLSLNYFEFSGDSQAWNTEFKMIFENTNLWESTQRIYIEPPTHSRVSAPIDPQFDLHEIDKDLINNNDLCNISFISDEVYDFWTDWDDFSSSGGGLFLTNEKEIIGKCVADGITDKYISVRIETKEKYRNQGVATYLASKFMDWVSSRKKLTYWECSEDNTGSIKLAEKSGLTLYQRYSLFGFSII